MTAGRAYRPERYRGRHAAQPTTRPLASGWKGRTAAGAMALFTMLALTAYFDASEAQGAATPKRHTAMKYNYAQRGEWYKYGGTGPSRWDCSGLVQASYRKAGITLPRTTQQMLRSSKLVRTTKPRWGDLVFTSSGHVEMYVQRKNGVHWMHGAHKSGTRVGYKRVYKGASGYPKYFRVKGAG